MNSGSFKAAPHGQLETELYSPCALRPDNAYILQPATGC